VEPTRAAGIERLRQFIPAAGSRYTRRRNYDLGPDNRGNVSMLSPWLRRRLLLESEAIVAVAAAHGLRGAEKFIDEVFWRTYFRGWLAHRPEVWASYRAELEEHARAQQNDTALAHRVQKAVSGQTGNPAFDAWAQELVKTGYLHNHARMWFASIWVFTLRLPWVLGADFFLRHLLDGDPASNTLSWRWVSGLHTRGKTYLARRDNVLKFTDGRLDPGPDLASQPVIPEDRAPAQPGELILPEPEFPSGERYGDDSAWLLTDDDLSFPDGWPESLPIYAMNCLGALSPGNVALPVEQFCEQGMQGVLESRNGADAGAGGLVTPETIAEQLGRDGVRRLHHFHVPYGPAADALAGLQRQLQDQGIELRPEVRPFDRRAWPYANRGFFKLKKRIPRLVDALAEVPNPCSS